MKKLLLPVAFVLLSVFAVAQTVYTNYQDGKIWFKLKNDYRSLTSISQDPNNIPAASLPFMDQIIKRHSLKKLSLPFANAKKSDELSRIYLLEINDIQNVNTVIEELNKSGKVEYAEKVPLDKVFLTPNDPSYSSQWALTKISASSAWNYFSSGSNVVIAIVDDGVERTHSDLNSAIWINTGDNNTNGIDDDGNGYIDDSNGWDVADNDNNPNPTTPSFDHGTHVAGIAGARSNNSTGVASIGFSVKIMPVKASSNAGTVNAGYNGIIYAVDNGADVINMSWGGYTSSITAQNIIDYAYNAGVVLVAAAGNDNLNTVLYPAGYNHVIAVAASSSNDSKASFSNYGTWVDVTAPGQNIYSTTVGNTYGNKSGTSMASPMVAGLAGLMLSLNPALTPDDIETCIKSGADNIDAMNSSYIGELGSGRINADASMSCVNSTLLLPPVANFTSNFTTVTAGGSVTFTDLSLYTYSPVTYAWSFPGGTPSSTTLASPPPITYNTPGTYNVTLTVTNPNGSDIETKTGYITVTAASGCYKVNFPAPAGWTPTQYYAGATVGQDGWVDGVNVYDDKEKAMYFDASASPYSTLTNVWLAFGKAYSANSNKIVPIKIYDGTGGTVGTLLGTQNLNMGQIMSDVQGGYYTEVDFTNAPVTLPASKKFFVSVDLTNLCWNCTPKDTLSIVSNTNGQTTPSAIWEKQSDNNWYQYGTGGSWNLNASLYIHPWLNGQPALATFTQSAISVCEGNSISFDGTGSTYQDTLLWFFPGGTPIVSNNLSQTVNYNTPGNYNAILYVIGGGCSQFDSAFVSITVNANPSVTVNASATTICPGGSATLNAAGATSYTWSPPTGLSGTTGASVTASPTGNIQYNVTGTAANGCSNSANIQILIQQPPAAAINAPLTICSGTQYFFDGSLSTDANNFSWTMPGASPASSSAPSGIAVFNTSGTYSVILNVSNSCGTDADTVVVGVDTIPTAISNGPSSACEGAAVNFDASNSTNANLYNWDFTGGSPSAGSSVLSGTTYPASGTYTVTLIATNNCGSDTVLQQITVNPLPTASFSGIDTACTGEQLIFDASNSVNAGSYNWLFPGGTPASASGTIDSTIYNTQGTYTVTMIVNNTCGNDTAVSVVVINTCLGITTISEKQLNILYNYQYESAVIEFGEANSGKYIIRIFNEIGQHVLMTDATVTSSQQKLIVPLTTLSQGLYFISVSGEREQITKKIIR